MIKRFIIIFLTVSLFFSSAFAAESVMVWVQFYDKDHSEYSLDRPEEFLSQRSVERRIRQNIPLDFYDLPVSRFYTDSLLKDTGLTLFYTSKWLNGAMFKAANTGVAESLTQYDFVRFTEIAKPSQALESKSEEGVQFTAFKPASGPNPQTNTMEKVFPYSSEYQTEKVAPFYGAAEGQVKLVSGQSLHERGYWGDGKIISVLDAGYRATDTISAFKDLWNQGRVLGYYDFVNAREQLYTGHAHGTFVLSVMGGYLPGEFSGVATNASYWLLRTEDAASEYRVEEYNWLAGAEFADSVGADIINSSLGYTVFDDTLQNYSYYDLDGHTTIVARAANMAFSRGMLVVNSAGNYGAQNWRYIGSPADAMGTLAVGGTDADGIRVNFSSVGPTPDGRVRPQVMAQARAVAVANTMGAISTNANGTSFSAPLISGMAACLWEMFPDATNSQIKNAIIMGGDRYMNPDSLYGYGIPDFGVVITILEKKLTADNHDQRDHRKVRLFNNPLLPESALMFYAVSDEMISLELFNSNGSKVWGRESVQVFKGFNKIRPFQDLFPMGSGIYLIRLNFSNRSQTVKAIIL